MLGLGIAKGMMTTLKHMLFIKPVTIQYPEQQMDMPAWTRGRPRLIYNIEGGDLRCTACGACAIACPVDVIKIEQHAGPDRKKVLDRFDIDMGGCIVCALCVEACPFRAITMAPDFEMATYDRERSLVFNMHELRIPGTEEVDGAMEYIQGVKRGLAGQAARGGSAAKPAGAGAARPAPGAATARPAPAARNGAARAAAAPAEAGKPATPAARPAPQAPATAEQPEVAARPAAGQAGGEERKAPPKPPGRTGPAPMTATRARLEASRAQAAAKSGGGSESDVEKPST